MHIHIDIQTCRYDVYAHYTHPCSLSPLNNPPNPKIQQDKDRLRDWIADSPASLQVDAARFNRWLAAIQQYISIRCVFFFSWVFGTCAVHVRLGICTWRVLIPIYRLTHPCANTDSVLEEQSDRSFRDIKSAVRALALLYKANQRRHGALAPLSVRWGVDSLHVCLHMLGA